MSDLVFIILAYYFASVEWSRSVSTSSLQESRKALTDEADAVAHRLGERRDLRQRQWRATTLRLCDAWQWSMT